MDHKAKLEDLHRESLEKLEYYVNANKLLAPSDHKKIQDAKNEWQEAWIKLQEALIVLEQLEI
jgi:hypothetical protein